MSVVLNMLAKRRKYPVDLSTVDQECVGKVFVRALTKREQRELRGITAQDGEDEQRTAELKDYFVYGCILLDENGTQAIARDENQSPREFAVKAEAEMADVPEDNKMLVLKAFKAVNEFPSVDAIVKN